jgi:RNA polymerase sigma-70 factor (family 1)
LHPAFFMLPEEYDDNELLNLLVEGDEQAFTVIYNRYWRRLIGLAYAHTKDKFLAEEIVQEVFLSLWRRKSSLHITSLPAYLGTAVKFAIFKHVYGEKRRSEILNKITFPSSDSIESKINAKFLQEYVDGVVELLPEKCRFVYTQSRNQGLTIPEIAEKMAIAEKTVEAHLTKALKFIRFNLKELLILLFVIKNS